METVVVFIDELGAIAIIGVLSSVYGAIWRSFKATQLAPIALGVMFGLVAVLQMHAPISPFEGLIIDLRNVPVALAGAFLGFRGMLACLAIAAFTRLSMGGVGAVSGALGMSIAGMAGYLWSVRTRSWRHRGFGSLLLLAGVMSTHLFAAIIMPWDIAFWFYTHAALPLIALNLLVVPLLGGLLERETRIIAAELNLKDAITHHGSTQMLLTKAFFTNLRHRQAAAAPADVSGVLLIDLRRRRQTMNIWGADGLETILGAIRIRLRDALVHGDCVGLLWDGVIIVPLTATEIQHGAQLATGLRRAIADESIAMGDGARCKINVLIDIVAETDPALILDFHRSSFGVKADSRNNFGLNQARLALNASAIQGSNSKATNQRPFKMPEPELDLFAKAEMLMMAQAR